MKVKRERFNRLIKWIDRLEERLDRVEGRECCPLNHTHTPDYEDRIKELEVQTKEFRDWINRQCAILEGAIAATTTRPAPESKGLGALFDQQPVQHYRHTCACGTSVRVNRKPKEVCLKCKQPMMTSKVMPRGNAMQR
jgi:hypothetical protein